MNSKLYLKDGGIYDGENFGSPVSSAGEVVFSTGMMGYPEGLTDPSFTGQILVLTYPLVGNYGVPDKSLWESEKICVSGLIVSEYNDTPSHFQSKKTLAQWFKDEGIPLVQIKDTRGLTQRIRDRGSLLGKIINNKTIEYYDPNQENLVKKVSTTTVLFYKAKPKNAKTVILIDCGAKQNILRSLTKRNLSVVVVPWNFDFFKKETQEQLQNITGQKNGFSFDGVVISNGPGDPKFAEETISIIKKTLAAKIPTLGICLGHQLLTLASGGDTKKLVYGHRSQNQPCIMEGTPRCYITTQNHGFAVSVIPQGFKPWFTNANDGTNEGIIHTTLPFMSVQFHPEATPGPYDTEWVFDYFIERL